MYLSVKNQLRDLSRKDFDTLRTLCRLSKNLYNEALYSVRQYFFTERKFLHYESNYHVCKISENYKLLGTYFAQQTMRIVDRNFKSFFALLHKAKSGEYQAKFRIPHYLDKEGYFSLVTPRVNIKGEYLTIPLSRQFKAEHGELKFKIPPQLVDKKIAEVRIHPRNNARFFEIEFVYEQKADIWNVDPHKYLAIDLGLDNLATCVTNDGASFIIDGKQIKSFNRLYNKENARLQSIKDKQKIKGLTHRQCFNLRKRNNRINHAMHVAAAKILSFCKDNCIGNIVCGCNSDWKQGIDIGKVGNQNFVQIPHGKLRQILKYLCELHGINYIEQEESYTSKASFFDDDFIPVYTPNSEEKHYFSGRRITRGQYRAANKQILNADVNGALNILRKSKLISLRALQSSGCVTQPQRIRAYC